MRFNVILSLLLALLATSAVSQTLQEKTKFKSYKTASAELGEVNYHLRADSTKKDKPLLIYLDGSGWYPLFMITDRGLSSTIPLTREIYQEFNVLTISKPGVPLTDSVKMTDRGPEYPEPAEYTKRLSLDWRVSSAKLALSETLSKHKLKPAKIVVLGISEGFQVAAKLASVEPRISHVSVFVGNGLTQFYDFILDARLKAATGQSDEKTTEQNITSLIQTFGDIQRNPNSTDKKWQGHTYKRWASFCANEPVNNLLGLSIPIYVVGASKDKNSTILSADYISVAFALKQKSNLTYKTYPYDHSFNELQTDASGRVTGAKSHMLEVLNDWLQWVMRN